MPGGFRGPDLARGPEVARRWFNVFGPQPNLTHIIIRIDMGLILS